MCSARVFGASTYGPGKPDEPAIHSGRAPALREQLAIQREERRHVRAGGVPHQHDVPRVAAELLRVLLHPRDGLRAVVQERRKLHVGIQAIVRQHRDEAALGQRRADEAILGLGCPLSTSRRTRRSRRGASRAAPRAGGT